MAVDDIDLLRRELPEIFEDRLPPSGWPDEWQLIPIRAVKETLLPALAEFQESLITESKGIVEEGFPGAIGRPTMANDSSALELPEMDDDTPGGPCYQWLPGAYPPPNALAFYLPFHYYHHPGSSGWWGVYLTVEGVRVLGEFIWRQASRRLSKAEALFASQVFLYGQKVYHHNVEGLATRLEIAHRIPLYKVGFRQFYQRDAHKWEDTLATAHGYLLATRARAFRGQQVKQHAVAEALQAYIDGCPEPYKWARAFFTAKGFKPKVFRGAEGDFAEANYKAALPDFPQKKPWIWLTFPHAFSGLSRITSRVNYIIHRDSPLYQRLRLYYRPPSP